MLTLIQLRSSSTRKIADFALMRCQPININVERRCVFSLALRVNSGLSNEKDPLKKFLQHDLSVTSHVDINLREPSLLRESELDTLEFSVNDRCRGYNEGWVAPRTSLLALRNGKLLKMLSS
jgi:hypothetical protein